MGIKFDLDFLKAKESELSKASVADNHAARPIIGQPYGK